MLQPLPMLSVLHLSFLVHLNNITKGNIAKIVNTKTAKKTHKIKHKGQKIKVALRDISSF